MISALSELLIPCLSLHITVLLSLFWWDNRDNQRTLIESNENGELTSSFPRDFHLKTSKVSSFWPQKSAPSDLQSNFQLTSPAVTCTPVGLWGCTHLFFYIPHKGKVQAGKFYFNFQGVLAGTCAKHDQCGGWCHWQNLLPMWELLGEWIQGQLRCCKHSKTFFLVGGQREESSGSVLQKTGN